MTLRRSASADTELRKLIAPQLRDIGRQIADTAAANAPHGDRVKGNAESYRYRVERGRIVVGSTDPNAHIIEFGSATSPEYAPLRSAIRQLGLTLDDLGRSGGATGRIRGAGRTRRRR